MTERESTYRGAEVEITYDRTLCIHAAECGRGSKDLFNVKNDPWCSPDAVPAEEAFRVVARCPSGALKIKASAGASPANPEGLRNEVSVQPNGPLFLQGDIEIDGQQVGPRVALCRCGASKAKPFCDGTHSKVSFRDAGPINADTAPGAIAAGKLRVRSANNGPLLLQGNVVIRAGSGREAFAGTKCALCRCGQSKNRPFCDGTHAKVGFES